ncbi:MAG: FAD-dependent oxidoreductase [Candidatus Omnitrophica bacterium]|nr:FAD-dependent oxidoreductase [Candidatus Omnitrophota bacterium]
MAQEFELKIKEVIQRTYNTKSVRLELTPGVDYRAGQFMCVTLKSEPVCKRYLSISSSPTEKGYIEFTKKLTQSDFSCALDRLKPGEALNIQYPLGKFTLDDNPSDKIAFISGGIGITPIRSIAKYVVDKNLGTDMILLYANRSVKDIVFKEDFDAMQKAYPKLKVAHVLCEAAPDFKCTVGLINAQIIKNEIQDYKERKFFLCGPPLMVEAMRKMLTEELAVEKEGIITENFIGY